MDFEGKSLDPMRSYLSNRKHFVQLDTFKSKVLNSPETSVIQGGKLSGLLYYLFIKTYSNLNSSAVKDTSNLTVQFVDDGKLTINLDKTQVMILDKNHQGIYL